MVCIIKTSGLALWLLLNSFFSLHDGTAVATIKMVDNEKALADAGREFPSTEQKLFNFIPKSSSYTIIHHYKRFQGRKVLGYKLSTRRVMMTVEGPNKESSSKISGATHDSAVGKYDEHERKEKLTVESKMLDEDRSFLPARKVNLAGFTAFSADYHVPRPHPPRNN